MFGSFSTTKMTIGKSFNAFSKNVGNFIFEYETPKIVTIRSVRVGLINRFLQAAIISYIVGYVIIYTKGYQDRDDGLSTVMTKVKGISSSLNRSDLTEEYQRIWDTADYIIPPMLKDAVFIATNAIITIKQRNGICPEDPDAAKDAKCNVSLIGQCEAGGRFKQGIGNGVLTGNCVDSDRSNHTVCEVKTWCPVENDKINQSFFHPLLDEAGSFTIFVKNAVEFPKFKKKRRNIDSIKDPKYVKRCVYHPKKEPTCPIFRLGDMIEFAGANVTDLSIFGGVINVLIDWNCNLDFSITRCNPKFYFSQMDESQNDFSKGHNFRYAYYYRENGTLYRDLIKVYGVLFLFNVKAQAGKFDIVNLMLNIGAGLALLGITSVLMDMIVFQFGKDRQYYRDQKFVTVTASQCRRHKQFAGMASALVGTAVRDNKPADNASSLNSLVMSSANSAKRAVFAVDGVNMKHMDDDSDDERYINDGGPDFEEEKFVKREKSVTFKEDGVY